ncbi:hypothetical protein QVD17_34081 [Tagetes erecta]|uniref:Uncharacterized protein n=1 Tax=Tagetes erecta TaxID=13708 RepID=A0AAD8JY38_TARER|nr:hypothetical protein QVD17_34081 [Tagetes erecta]
MGTTTEEKGVLKLVHPGRHVEYHRTPITAGEIMRKNPRHGITRPDFFKYPNRCALIRPESVMVPGQVFFIVPNTTIHRLVKDKSQQHGEPSSQQNESCNSSDYKHVPKHTTPSKLWAGRTPINRLHHEQEASSSHGRSLLHARETITTNHGEHVTRSVTKGDNGASTKK